MTNSESLYGYVTMSPTLSTRLTKLLTYFGVVTRGKEMALVRNVGSIDKIIRLVAGLGLAGWGILGAGLSSTIGLIALVVGVVLIATGSINFCPLFKILGISSIRSPDETN